MPRSLVLAFGLTATALSAVPSAAAPSARGVFCSALDRALAAAEGPQPFESLRLNMAGDPNWSRLSIPGIRSCSVGRYGFSEGNAHALWCRQTLAPPELTVENLTADTARCLGRQPEDRDGDQVFDLGRVVIRIAGHCTDECQVGRSVEYRIEVAKP